MINYIDIVPGTIITIKADDWTGLYDFLSCFTNSKSTYLDCSLSLSTQKAEKVGMVFRPRSEQECLNTFMQVVPHSNLLIVEGLDMYRASALGHTKNFQPVISEMVNNIKNSNCSLIVASWARESGSYMELFSEVSDVHVDMKLGIKFENGAQFRTFIRKKPGNRSKNATFSVDYDKAVKPLRYFE